MTNAGDAVAKVFAGSSTRSVLSAAYWLTDAATNRGPVDGFRVLIREQRLRAVRNASGFHCFLDLPPGDYVVNVEPDHAHGGGAFFGTSLTLQVDENGFTGAIPVPLAPRPSYPFPGDATLLVGRVVHAGVPDERRGIDGVDISVPSAPALRSRTASSGTFALFFAPAGLGAGALVRFAKDGVVRDVLVNVPPGTRVNQGDIELG
jgi:hypothetical protein